jgi:hypothetical protein
MKQLPPDTSIANFEYPAYEQAHLTDNPHLADIPKAEGFAPFDKDAPKPSAEEAKPVVQNAVFQDFSKIIEQPQA